MSRATSACTVLGGAIADGHVSARSPTAGGGGWGGVPDDLQSRRRGCCGRNKWIAAGCVSLFLLVFFRWAPWPRNLPLRH